MGKASGMGRRKPTLQSGENNVTARRRVYIDEDTLYIVLSDMYDRNNTLVKPCSLQSVHSVRTGSDRIRLRPMGYVVGRLHPDVAAKAIRRTPTMRFYADRPVEVRG